MPRVDAGAVHDLGFIVEINNTQRKASRRQFIVPLVYKDR
jgi:hypothetical protein